MYHVGTGLSVFTLLLFNVERVLLVRFTDAERQRRVLCGCRMALAFGGLVIFAICVPVLALFSYKPHAALQCFIQTRTEVQTESTFEETADRPRALLLGFYLFEIVIYSLAPVTLLPALAACLLFSVRTRLSEDYSALLLHDMDEQMGHSTYSVCCSARQQARVAKQLVVLSLLAALLLFPNLCWIPWAIGKAVNYVC